MRFVAVSAALLAVVAPATSYALTGETPPASNKIGVKFTNEMSGRSVTVQAPLDGQANTVGSLYANNPDFANQDFPAHSMEAVENFTGNGCTLELPTGQSKIDDRHTYDKFQEVTKEGVNVRDLKLTCSSGVSGK